MYRAWSAGLLLKSAVRSRQRFFCCHCPQRSYRVFCFVAVAVILLCFSGYRIYLVVSPDCRKDQIGRGSESAQGNLFERDKSAGVFRKQCVSFNLTGQSYPTELTHEPTSSTNNAGTKQFPKVIHRTWKTTNVPRNWLLGEVTCQLVNLDHQYCHWTDEELNRFIASEYPLFVETFRKYRYPIQRVDAARYFIMYHFGGVYLDLDITCSRNFKGLTTNFSAYDVLLGEAEPTGVVGDFIVSRPKSAFMAHVVSGLFDSNRWYGLPYLSVMLSTGPWFLSGRYWSYCDKQENGVSGIYVLPAEAYQRQYLHHLTGRSWQSWDGLIIWKVFTWRYRILIIAVIFVVLSQLWKCFVQRFGLRPNSFAQYRNCWRLCEQ